MARNRFTTAREVFDAFPSARDDIGCEPSDESPSAYIAALAATETPENALTFCAYVLPRREAVWWGCQCLRALNARRGAADMQALEAAEAWVREPEDHRRRAALTLGMSSDRRAATTWAALAAGWSGGNVAPGEGSLAAPPQMTAKAVRVAVLTGLAQVPARDRAERLQACIGMALQLLNGPSSGAR